MSRKLIDLTGRVIGNLTVLKRAVGRGKDKSALWLCKCACGNEHVAVSCNLLKGYTRSCGCLRKRAFVNNMHLGRERANARRQAAKAAPSKSFPVMDLAPLLRAAGEYWANQDGRAEGRVA